MLNDVSHHILKREFFSLGSFIVHLWRQRCSDQDDQKGEKSGNETCFQNSQSFSWLVVWYNQFGPQDSNQIHWHQEPTRRHIDKEQVHTWWVEPSFVFIQHWPFQLHQRAQSDVEKNTRRCRWRKSHGKIKAYDEFGITMPCKESNRACFDCIWKPGENQIWKSESTSRLVKCAANRYGEPVMLASSSNSSEWNNDDKWSSQVRKSGESSKTRTVKPVSNELVISIENLTMSFRHQTELTWTIRLVQPLRHPLRIRWYPPAITWQCFQLKPSLIQKCRQLKESQCLMTKHELSG